MAGRLAGKVAIVTGAARGIGAAIARTFAGEGASLALLDRDGPGVSTIGAELDRVAPVLAANVDITERADVEAGISAAVARFGRVDILINNAGANVFADPMEMTDEEWRRCLAVNLEGAWHMIRAALEPMLSAGRGSIVNVASTHAFSIIPGCFPYPVAKHGLIGLTRSLGVEYGPRGIRVNAIAPGYIETEGTRAWIEGHDNPAAMRARVEGLIPVRRMGAPQEVAWAAVYLASDESAFTNASVLTMDGGRSVVYHD